MIDQRQLKNLEAEAARLTGRLHRLRNRKSKTWRRTRARLAVLWPQINASRHFWREVTGQSAAQRRRRNLDALQRDFDDAIRAANLRWNRNAA